VLSEDPNPRRPLHVPDADIAPDVFEIHCDSHTYGGNSDVSQKSWSLDASRFSLRFAGRDILVSPSEEEVHNNYHEGQAPSPPSDRRSALLIPTSAAEKKQHD
jgi:hypothetical protein